MKKTIGWALVGLGVVAVGYLGWGVYHTTTFFYPWYDFIPFYLAHPSMYQDPYFWRGIGIPLVAGALLLVFGIRMLKTNKRAKV